MYFQTHDVKKYLPCLQGLFTLISLAATVRRLSTLKIRAFKRFENPELSRMKTGLKTTQKYER